MSNGITVEVWATMLLDRLKYPRRQPAVDAVVAWAACEGGGVKNDAFFNPLNTTRPYAGSRSINRCGVQAFATLESGLVATVQTLNLPPYYAIRAGLRGYTDADQILTMVNASPWGTHPHWPVSQLVKYGSQVLREPDLMNPPQAATNLPTLSQGMNGHQVKMLQNVLALRLATANRLVADGVFGPATKAAVMRYQQLHHLEVDGICGPATWRSLSPHTLGQPA